MCWQILIEVGRVGFQVDKIKKRRPRKQGRRSKNWNVYLQNEKRKPLPII